MTDGNASICPTCHQAVLPEYFFCPNCGTNLKENVIPVSLPIQIGIYALSILLPPLGLWPGISYLKKNNPQAKRVGTIAIVLTVIASLIAIWAIFAIFQIYLNQLSEALNGI